MSSSERQKRRLGLFLILLCPALVALVLPHAPDLSVQTRATPQLSAANWQTLWMAGEIPYQWISSRVLLVKKPDGPYIIDTVSKKAIPAAAIRMALSKHPELGRLSQNGPREWVASPDGQWLLTAAIDRSYHPQYGMPFEGLPGKCVLVKLDGSQVITRPTTFRHEWQALWGPKSDSWVVANLGDFSPHITRWRLDANEPTTVAIGSNRSFGPTPNILGFLDNNRLLLGSWGRAVEMEVLDLRLPHDYHPRSQISMPHNAQVVEIECSPRGDRLAWLLSFRPSTLAPLEMLPFIHATPGHTSGEVWISNMDGSDMHPLVTGAVSPERRSGPHFVRWTPDETKVSFVDDDTLYTIPAL